MFGSTPSGANAYAKVGIETGVAAASPHSLIVMLFEGAMIAVSAALQYMQAGDIQNKGLSISKAIMIIDNGLRASLDKTAGGEIAASLDALYEYMSGRLLMANLKNRPEMLEEVHRLLKDLKEAWEAIGVAPGASQQPAAPVPAAAPTSPYDKLTPQSSHLTKA